MWNACIYVYMTRITELRCIASQVHMLWVDRALAGARVLQEVVWGLSCPLHCGGSGVPLFGFGLLLGFCTGVGITLAALWILWHLHPPASSAGHSPSPSPPPREAEFRRRSRVLGYLQ